MDEHSQQSLASRSYHHNHSHHNHNYYQQQQQQHTSSMLPFSPPSIAVASSPANFVAHAAACRPLRPPNTAPSAGGPHTLLGNVTVKLGDVFHGCDPHFHYDRSGNPRRILTKPGRPCHNSGWDNEKWDYILYVNDVIGEEEGRRYVIIDILGQGTFGQVVKCQNMYTREMVAVKVIKNQPAYYNQSMMEVTVLEMINNKYDREDARHIIRLRDTFVFRGHLCIVVELLSVNLYELIKQNQYRGFSLRLCRIFLAQVLDALCVLKEAHIVHCDLKPENILLKSLDKPAIKVIDFGSACHEHQTVYTYIQSRFYRSPEVLLGLPYSSSIDMWSLGCIAVELFLGLPIFPGASNYDQVARIVETLGLPPFHMLEVGKDTGTYFERLTVAGPEHRPQYQLKSRDRFAMEQGRPEPPSKRYFASTDLEEIVMTYEGGNAHYHHHHNPQQHHSNPAAGTPPPHGQISEEEHRQRRCFLHFVRGLLTINPVERWSPLQAINHPFITGHSLETLYGVAAIPIVVNKRTRPRANTLATLSLQDVPGALQKIAAAAQGSAAPPGGPTELRDEVSPEAVAASIGTSAIPVVLNDSSLAASSSSHGGGSIDAVLTQQPKKPDNLYTNRYVDNRRMSIQALSFQQDDLQQQPLRQQQYRQQSQPKYQQPAEPNSLPNWYNLPQNKRSTCNYNGKRRESAELLRSPLSPASPSATTAVAAATLGNNEKVRTRRRSTNRPATSPMGSINEDDSSS